MTKTKIAQFAIPILTAMLVFSPISSFGQEPELEECKAIETLDSMTNLIREETEALQFEPVNIKCGSDKTIFKNKLKDKSVLVTVQATDKCEAFDSEVGVVMKKNKVDKDQIEEVPDGGTITVTFKVPPGGSIYFDCLGGDKKGNCTYQLSEPTIIE